MRKFFTIFLTVLFISMLLAGCNTRSEYTNLINISPVGFTVSITSLPNGASVFVNNEYKGITPCGVSLKKGTYRFIVIKDDYISQRKDIKIVENTNLNFELKKPKIKGTLNSISFDELKGGIVFDELFISRQENEIVCISLATGKELWRKNFNNTTNFMLADNTLCLENQKREEATETSPRKFIEEIFAVNSYSGETIKSSKFEIVPDEKNTILWLSNISDDVAFFEEFILMYGGIPNVIYLKAYSLKDDKLLYNRKFIAEPSNMPIFGDHLHLFGSSDGHLIIYKVDKFKGTTLSQMEFPEIKSSNIGFNVETLDTDGEKVVVQTFSTTSYIIDLEKQKIVYKAKGNPLVQGGRYIVFFDEYNSGDNLLTEVTDVTSMKQIGFITYDIKEESKVMYPFVTLPVYDSQNRRIFIFINDEMFCFNEEGKELPLPGIFKSSYRHLLNVTPADVPGIKSLEDARKREKYEKGKGALDKLKGALEKYKQLEIYNENDEQLWRECEKDLKNFDEEKKNTLAELKNNEEELKETIEKLSEVERDFRVFDDRKKKIDEVKLELKNYEMGVGKVKSEETKNRFYTAAAITSAILLSISILGAIMNPSLIFYVLIVSFLISTSIFSTLSFSFTQKKAHFAAVFERIRLVISRFELDAEDPKEVYSNIQKFDEKYQKKYEELQEIKSKKEKLDDKNRELQNRTIPAIEKRIKDAEEKIDEIKIKSREGSLEQYTGKLKLKQELERSAEEQKSILKSHFEEKSKKWEENISQWDEEIGNLEEYKDRARDIKYSETTASELKEKKQKFKEELEEMNNRMGSLQKEMDTVQWKANEILPRLEGEYLYCKTSVDLKAINDKLQGFINENESNKDNVLEVMKIFEEIETGEKEKVSELFGKDSPISKYFSEITDNLYEEVTFNQGAGKIEIKRSDGKILEAEKLSGGAYDQLYFSIRLALGEKLLKGEKGFFVMDDPFVKADPDRLQRQIEMLKKISELGWQVMYFSAKGEIRDVLEEDIKKSAINNIEIQDIFS